MRCFEPQKHDAQNRGHLQACGHLQANKDSASGLGEGQSGIRSRRTGGLSLTHLGSTGFGTTASASTRTGSERGGRHVAAELATAPRRQDSTTRCWRR
jgi:hypothetical protein